VCARGVAPGIVRDDGIVHATWNQTVCLGVYHRIACALVRRGQSTREEERPVVTIAARYPIGTPLGRRLNTAIHAPGVRLLRAVPLRFLHRGAGKTRVRSFDLNMTAMIDFLIVTVVFLLNQFGAAQAGSNLYVDIPSAAHSRALQSAPVLTVTQSAVLLDSARVSSVAEVRSTTDRLEVLYQHLQDARRVYGAAHPGEAFEGLIVLQVERTTPWDVMRRLLNTASQAGYTQPEMAVNSRSERARPE
jgi:hypothetical protein